MIFLSPTPRLISTRRFRALSWYFRSGTSHWCHLKLSRQNARFNIVVVVRMVGACFNIPILDGEDDPRYYFIVVNIRGKVFSLRIASIPQDVSRGAAGRPSPYHTLRHPCCPIYPRHPYLPKGAKGTGTDAQP